MGTVHSGQLQDRKNMAKFLILSACLANHGLVGHAHLGHGLVGHAGVVGTHVVPGPTAVHEQVHAGPATNHASVRALPAPPLPVPAAPAALPVPATVYGPAPADTVTTVAVDAPVRTHTKITPRLHRIEPELQVTKYH